MPTETVYWTNSNGQEFEIYLFENGGKHETYVTALFSSGMTVNIKHLWAEMLAGGAFDNTANKALFENISKPKRFTGTDDNDTITKTEGGISGLDGDDTLNAYVLNGKGQSHTYCGDGDDQINMNFYNISDFSHGHHSQGDGYNTEIYYNEGDVALFKDTFNFQNLGNVHNLIVGRFEDFDPSRDTITIEGDAVNIFDLDAYNQGDGKDKYILDIINFNGAHNDAGTLDQQWLRIKVLDASNNVQGVVFYSLNGARVDMNGDGITVTGAQEAHFLPNDLYYNGMLVDMQFVLNQAAVDYIDPKDYLVDGVLTADSEGLYIQDIDAEASNVKDIVDGTNLAAINGSAYGDVIAAGLNDDDVYAGAGDDVVWGGSGHDLIYGGNGEDFIEGNTGHDTIYGGNDNDRLFGGTGDDKLNGGDGRDFLSGGEGNDELRGGNLGDTLFGNEGADTLYGNGGWDRLYGGEGDDVVRGDWGKDSLYGGDGNDSLYGGNHNDKLYGGAGMDTLSGESGDDKLFGGSGDDTLYGSDGSDKLYGGNNDDKLYGGRADDIMYGGSGDDSVFGNSHDDIIHGNSGADTLGGGLDNDQIFGGTGNDAIYGGPGDDTMTGGAHSDTFIFIDGFGVDVITDFEALNDSETIDLSGLNNITNMADLTANHLTQTNNDVLITDGADSITLTGVNLADLDAFDFIF